MNVPMCQLDGEQLLLAEADMSDHELTLIALDVYAIYRGHQACRRDESVHGEEIARLLKQLCKTGALKHARSTATLD